MSGYSVEKQKSAENRFVSGMNLNLRKNAVWALGEVIVSGLTLFLLYKIIISSLGVKALGIWSLVLATTSLGRLADIGTAAGLGRFVAATEAKDNAARALLYVETAVITNALLYIVIALVIALPAYYGLALSMDGEALVQARQLLPFSLISFVLMSITAATTGAIIGQHRSDQKSMIVLAGLVVQFAIAVLLVPHYGLPALAWAQIAQYATLIIGGWLLFLRNHFKTWTFRLPIHWHKDVFKELIGFGAKLQVVSIVSMLYDPIVKFLISSLGGLETLGFYEMAQRLILQVRQIIVTPTQPLVPSFAHLMESERQKIAPLYHKALTLSVIFGFLLLGGIAITSPLISYLWIGHVEQTFVVLTVILSVGWYINLVAAPAYLLGIGTGHVKGNVYGTCLTTGGAGLLGFILGHFFGGYGVAVAASLMQATGSLLSMMMNCRVMGIAAFPPPDNFHAVRGQILQILKTGKL